MKDIPDYCAKEKSAIRKFALEALREFGGCAEVGDVMEVTGFPVVSKDPIKNADKMMQALSQEMRNVECKEIKRFRRKGRVFLERREPWEPYVSRKPNPYPGDIPRV